MLEKTETKFVLECAKIFEKRILEIAMGLDAIVEPIVQHPSDRNYIGIPVWIPNDKIPLAITAMTIVLAADPTSYMATRGDTRKTYTKEFSILDDPPVFTINKIAKT